MGKRDIVYTYLLNYNGEKQYDEKNVSAAFIDIAIKLYKDGKEIPFKDSDKDIKYGECYLSDVYQVFFNRKKIFGIKKNPQKFDLFRLIYDADDIKAEVVGYGLDVMKEMPQEISNALPDTLKTFPYAEAVFVSKDEFEKFIMCDVDGFATKDNEKAEVITYAYRD